MDNTNIEELAGLSGEEYYRRPSLMKADEIRLNGQEGYFVRVKYDSVKKEYVKEKLGNEIEVVLLRKRRRLVYFNPKRKEDNLTTSEHNSPNDVVALFRNGGTEKGTAAVFRSTYSELRTQEIFYGLLDNELVKIVFKGASLGSENKPKDSVSLYDYLNQFSKEEHVFQFITTLSAKEEEGGLGHYYAISCTRNRALDDQEMSSTVAPKIKEIHKTITDVDQYYRIKEAEVIEKELAAEEVGDVGDDIEIEEVSEDNNPF